MAKKPRANKHLRDMDSNVFVVEPVPPDFQLFAIEKVLPTISFTGKKLVDKKTIAMHCLHKLYLAGITGGVVADSRRWAAPGATLRIAVWDAIVAADYAAVCIGSQHAKMVTRYEATAKLLDLKKEWELSQLMDLTLYRNSELDDPTRLALVFAHRGRLSLDTGRLLPEELQKQAIPFPKGPGNDYFRAIEDTIESINESNLNFRWKAYRDDRATGCRRVLPVNPCLRQVHSGDFFRAVRLYTWGELGGQNLHRSIRKTIEIDGEPTCELDYSAMAIRLLYHSRRVPTGDGDLYRPECVFQRYYSMENANELRFSFLREFVKRVTNICLNTPSRAKANSAVGRAVEAFEYNEWLKKIISRTEEISIPQIVDRVVTAHPPEVSQWFFCEEGLELMTADGKIMLHILLEFVEAGRPALGIHDSLVVRQSDREFAHAVMTAVYRRFTRCDPVINVKE